MIKNHESNDLSSSLKSCKEIQNIFFIYNKICLRNNFVLISYERTWFRSKSVRTICYPAKSTRVADYADDLAILTNILEQTVSLLNSQEHARRGIGLYMTSDNAEWKCFKHDDVILTLKEKPEKLDHLIYHRSYTSSTESLVNVRTRKPKTAIDRLSNVWKFYLPNRIKPLFFPVITVSGLLYCCTTWTLAKCQKKKLLGENYIRMMDAVSNKLFPAAGRPLDSHVTNNPSKKKRHVW